MKKLLIALAISLGLCITAEAGTTLLLRVGGNSGPHSFTPLPLQAKASANFSQNQSFGYNANGLLPNGGVAGSFYLPNGGSFTLTDSWVIPFDLQIDPHLFGGTALQSLFKSGGAGNGSGMFLIGNNAIKPTFNFKQSYIGQGGSQWWQAASAITANQAVSITAGTNYNTGLYTATATGGHCRVEPSLVYQGGLTLSMVSNPGWDCNGWSASDVPTVSVVSMPGSGARQNTGLAASPPLAATTCAIVNGRAQITANVNVAHGITPGMIYILQGMTPSGLNGTFTAQQGTGGTTLVGTTLGTTCPTPATATVDGSALSGTGNAISFPSYNPIASPPWGLAGTGITVNNGKHVSGVLVQNGDDSPFPGAVAMALDDDKGVPIDGSPRLVQNLNQGRADFMGHTVTGAQSPSNPLLIVDSMIPTTITAGVYSDPSALAGTVRFTLTGTNNYIPGSEFTVSGMAPSAVNITYVALKAGSDTTHVVGNPLSGPNGILQPITNPGTITTATTPQAVSVILPGMQVYGAYILNNASIAPYGTFGSTGVGYGGTYGINSINASGITNFTASFASGGAMTASGVGFGPIVVGSIVTGIVGGTGTARVTGYGVSTVGQAGTYTTDWAGGPVGAAVVSVLTVGVSGTPAPMMAYSGYFYTGAGVPSSTSNTLTTHTAAGTFDFVDLIGASVNQPVKFTTPGWGGNIGNVGMIWGKFPMDTSGYPLASAVTSLAKKTTTIHALAIANGMTPNSIYELDDIGIFGDSAYGDFHGHTAGSTLTVDTIDQGSLPAVSGSVPVVKISGPGLPVTGVQVTSGSAGGPYTLASAVATLTPESMKAGKWAPATPIQSGQSTGYIDSSNILHVTAIPTGGEGASFTGQLTSEWTGSMAITTGVMTLNSLQTGVASAVGLGTVINSAPGAATTFGPCTITGLLSGSWNVAASTYSTTCTPGSAIAAELMDGSGILPAGPTVLNLIGAATGTIQIGSVVTDGGINIVGNAPPVINALLVASTKYNVNGNYLAPVASETMTSALGTLVPGTYIRNAALTTPVKIVAFIPGACANVATAAILNGGLGCYSLSNNANGTAGSSFGSPLLLATTTIGDGSASAPGIGLTILDRGPQTTFPITNYGAVTGNVSLSGTYDVPTLGGTPSAIQVLVSYAYGGPAISGCTPCNWGTLSGTPSGGVWSGAIAGIPAGGPYFISVRAANGTAYQVPGIFRVGLVFDMWGEGQNTWISTTGGTFLTYFSGMWNITGLTSGSGFSNAFLVAPILPEVFPAFTMGTAGDRFGANGLVLPEGVGYFEQGAANYYGGAPVNMDVWLRDGTGTSPFTTGNTIQTQTIDVGDGTKKVWCSSLASTDALCAGASGGTIGRNGLLVYNAASLTGGWFTGSVAGNSPTGLSTVSVDTYVGGAFEPGMILSGPGITGTPKLLYCIVCPGGTLVGLTQPTSGTPQSSTWVLDTNLGTIGSTTRLRVDPPASMIPFGLSSTPYPTFNFQQGSCCGLGAFGAFNIKASTFQLIDTDPTTHIESNICSDSQQFAYSITGGNCTGAQISSAFINYQTGDYQFAFTTAPAVGHIITAKWTNVTSPEGVSSQQFSRPANFDWYGDGTSQSGPVSSVMSKSVGGVNAHMFIFPSSDLNYLSVFGVAPNQGYQFGAQGYSELVSWYYTKRMPNTLPGMTASTPVAIPGLTRAEGASSFNIGATGFQQLGMLAQFAEDFTTSSVLTGTIASNILTLGVDAVGPVWEGEVLGGGTLNGVNGSSGTGVFITSLATGVWGKATSTYNLSGMSTYNSGGTASGTFFNDIFNKGGVGIYAGGNPSVSVQSRSNASTVGAGGHLDNGQDGGGRNGRSMASGLIKGLANPNVPLDPTPDRLKANATGCDAASKIAPCFDIGATFEATHTSTWSPTGNVVSVPGGLLAHERNFVVGQLFTCSGCNTNLFITSVSLPPTQDTRAGQGQVGQSFTFTVANASGQAIGGTGTGTVHAGCSGTSGAGATCIDVAFTINASGSFGTAKALATCGENNLNGNSPLYALPSGQCIDTGIGALVRYFRIGTNQNMTGLTNTGNLFDDGVDYAGGNFTQNGAFTCNIVAVLIVQCVKAPTLNTGPTGNGLVATTQVPWASGATFISYGDTMVVTGRQGSMMGTIGGSSFPFSNGGSGYSNQTITATCPTIQGGGFTANFDIKTNGGAITDIYLSSVGSASGTRQATGLGIIAPCTIVPTGGTGAVIAAVPFGMLEGLPGIATYNSSANEMGTAMNDNSGFPGNPSNVFYTNSRGGYFEPGDAVRAFGQFMGLAVSG